jgi:hypothetical protein
MTNKSGLDRLDLAEAQRIGNLVEMKLDGFLKFSPELAGDDHEQVFKEAFIELLFNGVLRLNNNEDPRVKVNSPKITPEVVDWYKEVALALEEEETLREKYRKVLSGEKITEH